MTYPTVDVQEGLVALGFLDPGDDDVNNLNDGIVAFKKSIGFRARPYVGPLTWAALTAPVVPEALEPEELPWMAEAKAIKGLHERRNTSTLEAWFDRSVSWIDPREIPWCGAYVATSLRRWDPDVTLFENPLGARNWLPFGESCAPQYGAILVFWRGSRSGWKGHVGFYVGEDDAAYHVLGGNQSNAVTVTRISKSRLLGARWPKGHAQPGRIVRLDRAGAPLSTNEA